MNAKILRLVGQNLKRNTKDFVFSSLGIVIGISTFIFFVALGQGIKTTVLEDIFVINQLEVVPKTYDVGVFKSSGLFGGGAKLDDGLVKELSAQPGIKGVYPKMRLMFPARGWGGKELIGKNFWTELIADGLPEELVASEINSKTPFKDWDAAPISCTSNDQCPDGRTCGTTSKTCEKVACEPPPTDRRGVPKSDDSCPGKSYCGQDTKTCEMPIPVVLNPRLVEIYNGSIHTAMKGSKGALSKIPKLTPNALVGFSFGGTLGKSYLGSSEKGNPITRRFELVGFSPKAINIGATMPIGYVKRFNTQFRGEESTATYHSLLVETERNEDVARAAQIITEDFGLALDERYENAQKAGLVISIVTGVFSLISVIIILIAAINIMHTFLMVITERRKEIGLMRAIGATRSDIRLMVLLEASVIGLVGGILGCLLGAGVALGIDAIFTHAIGAFPFKPSTLFAWEAWFFGIGVGSGILFCLLGATIPAIRASNLDPAAALTGH